MAKKSAKAEKPAPPPFLGKLGFFLFNTGRLYWKLRAVADLPQHPGVRELKPRDNGYYYPARRCRYKMFRIRGLKPRDAGYYYPDWKQLGHNELIDGKVKFVDDGKSNFTKDIAGWMTASENFYRDIATAEDLPSDWKLQAQTAIVEARGIVWPFANCNAEYNLTALVQQLRRYPDVSLDRFHGVLATLRRLAISAEIAATHPGTDATPAAPDTGFKPLELRQTDGGGVAVLDGKKYPLTENQYRALKNIEDGNGAIVPGDKLKGIPGSGERPDKIIKGLPAPIRDLYEGKRGHGGGYVRKSPATRNN